MLPKAPTAARLSSPETSNIAEMISLGGSLIGRSGETRRRSGRAHIDHGVPHRVCACSERRYFTIESAGADLTQQDRERQRVLEREWVLERQQAIEREGTDYSI